MFKYVHCVKCTCIVSKTAIRMFTICSVSLWCVRLLSRSVMGLSQNCTRPFVNYFGQSQDCPRLSWKKVRSPLGQAITHVRLLKNAPTWQLVTTKECVACVHAQCARCWTLLVPKISAGNVDLGDKMRRISEIQRVNASCTALAHVCAHGCVL
jgi:hypothetical protein